MRIRLLDSTFGRVGTRFQYATTYLVNDTLAIDCGSLGFWGTPEDQARVRNVLLSHTHADHIASLPMFVENAYEPGGPPIRVWGSDHVLASLRQDLFNDRVFPNLLALPTPEAPFAVLCRLDAEKPVDIDGVRITPVPLNHPVPTFGMVLEAGGTSVAIVSDTGPTDRIWEVLNDRRDLKAVYLEATFPNDMHDLAAVSGHLTPALFAAELGKLRSRPAVVAVHLKARYQERVVAEVTALGLDNVRIAEPDREDCW